MKSIMFTDTSGKVPQQFYPIPAQKKLPDWFLKIKPYHAERANEGGRLRHMGTPTGKRCIPMFDAMTAGYIILSSCDIYISETEEGFKYYDWPDVDVEAIQFHDPGQMRTLEKSEKYLALPKLINPWAIVTPAGYSSMIVPPINHDNLPIRIFSGLVDTDTYNSPVNFPFLLSDENFTGMIPAGTPIAQVIPVKREVFSMKIGGELEIERHEKSRNLRDHKLLNAYRNFFWHRKEYR